MNRKILIIIIVLVAVIIIGLILFFAVGRGDVSKTPLISSFFPASEERERLPGEVGDGEEVTIIIDGAIEERKLVQLFDKPISGAAFSKDNKARYLGKISGHLYEADLDGKNQKRISNTTILNIFDIYWSSGADKAILRFLKDNEINNFAAFFTGSTTEGVFLSKNVKSAAVSPKEDKIAYLEDIGGRGIIFTADFENKNKKQVFSAPLSDFLIFWQDAGNLSLLTRPSASLKGFLYSLNIQNKNLDKLYEGSGLNILWLKNGEELFISESVNSAIENKILSLKDAKEYNLGLKTLPEKCVWSAKEEGIIFCAVPLTLASADYPDDWYQGKISFKDTVFKINYLTGENNIIGEKILDMDFDIINPFLSSDEKYLFFTNKKDSTLWSIEITD